ncbi:UDP-N-acetylglucosamine--undecaprenyl-phosphate N-acetylglucosaminephosphotransferase [Candidatus Methylobacter favarea]|nr:UDP-N-acetylglucosamine--undecaprenyl-phosphate N-acetylglucosaminephosphotransferase [Candidatus Methylobacter favarea]
MPLLATVFFIVTLYPCALKIGFTDKPTHRKQHQKHTPLVGGIAIYFALLVTFFINTNFFPHQAAFIAAATLLVCVGLIDDYKGLDVKIRLVTEIAAAFIMIEFAHIKIIDLGDLLGLGNVHLGNYATIFTIFAVVGGINAFNMIDGIDGLAGGLTLISIASIAVVSLIFQDWMIFNFCIIFIASILAFLLFNLRIFGRSSAKIFLGDTGSTLFGFTVCWVLIDASQGEKNLITPTTVLWVTALPLIDSVCIMLRRIRKRVSPFNPDREHLHHIFQVAGYSINQTLSILFIFSLVISCSGIVGSIYFDIPERILFLAFIFLFGGYYWLMNYAWKIMKISRYLRTTKIFDRRVKIQRKEVDMRSKIERRYIPTQQQLEKIYKGNGFFLAFLLKQCFLPESKKHEEPKNKEKIFF